MKMKNKKKLPVMEDVRKVFKIGDSLAITLPAEFVKEHGIKEGQPITLVYDGLLKAKPIKTEWSEEELKEVIQG
jgi:antitoxin component of MazEF toxin-antitoxin module